MRHSALLMLVLLACTAFGEDDPNQAAAAKTVTEVEFEDSDKLMKAIQGIEEDTVWIVEFHDNDPEKTLKDTLNEALKKEPLDAKEYQSLDYKVVSIDINETKFDKALEALGMTSNEFQATYPVALVMRKRKGLFAWGYDLGQAVAERLTEVADGKV